MLKHFFYFFFITSLSFLYSNTQNEKILICGVAKNCEAGFENMSINIFNLSCCFKDYHVFIYENNSIDQTKNLYHSWARCNKKITFISEDLSQEFISGYVPLVGNYRTQFIARARNKVLEMALNPLFDDFKYVLVVDLDGFDLWQTNEIVNSINSPQEEWDAIFANGAYDIYAFRSEECSYGPELLGNELWMKIYPTYGKWLSKRLKNNKWLKVNSAFGGLAIYKRDSIKNCYYSGLASPEMVQNLIMHKFEKDLFYNFFSKSIKHQIEKNKIRLKNWLKDGCSINSRFLEPLGSYDFYLCEHVFFHYMMQINGHDKLFINPNLILRSQEHVNF